MKRSEETDSKQAKLWNGAAGAAWVEYQDMLDRMFHPFAEILIESACSRSATRVLDVGCGAGATTLGLAHRIAGAGRCTGVDISEPMLEAAAARAKSAGLDVGFIRADAQTYPFEPAMYDMIVSRFGVMFFDDPVRAFSNLRNAARPGAGLHFISWRGPQDNPFMVTAEQAAAPLLPGHPAREADVPGQFGFANGERVRRILEESGWSGIGIHPLDIECGFPASELTGYFTRFGPLAQAFQDLDDLTQKRVIQTVSDAFAPYVRGDQVRFTAACWSVVAEAA
jgi:SAM-dependent methyltransferase